MCRKKQGKGKRDKAVAKGNNEAKGRNMGGERGKLRVWEVTIRLARYPWERRREGGGKKGGNHQIANPWGKCWGRC